MKFRKIALATAISFAIVGCGADDQAYDYLDTKPVDQVAIADITDNSAIQQENTSHGDAYEIPLDGIWLLQQSLGDVSRASSSIPYAQDFVNNQRLLKLKFTQDGLVGDLLEGDVTFEGDVTRFPADKDEPTLFMLPGSYNAYECAEDSYGDCTNKETTVSDTSVSWHEKTHFAPKFADTKIADSQALFKWYLNEKKETRVSHVEFKPEDGVVNIELTHDIVNRKGQPETAVVFFSLVRLDVVASKGYTPVHYDLAEHHKFGMFKTQYEKLNPNYIENQNGYEGYLINRFDPRKDRIEYHLSDEFFRKDENGNLVNQVWLDATVKGFEYINNSLKDQFSPGGRLVPELVLVNKDATEASGVKVGDLRTNTIHIIPEAANAGLLGYGPSTPNPLTGEIVNANTIMYPGIAQMGVGTSWDELVRLYNKRELSKPFDVENYDLVRRSQAAFSSELPEVVNAPVPPSFKEYSNQISENIEELTTYEDIAESDALVINPDESIDHLEAMIANNMYPAELSGISSSLVANKTDITELDFFELGMFVDAELPEDQRTLKEWTDLNDEQRAAISLALSTHQYLTTLVHEIGHNLGLRHNFRGSFDGDNFYTEEQAKALDLKGVSATSSIMDYTPSEINVHPAFGMYDRAALRFAYQRSVAVHAEIDESSQTREEILAVKRATDMEYRSLLDGDAAKRSDLANSSALKSLLNGTTLSSEGLQLKDYGYCTDARGRRNTETGCRVFDEGTTVEAITDNNIERYETSFDLVNTRRDRVEFNESKRSVNKFFSLHGRFSRMNMIVDDYYQEHRSSPKTPAEVCSNVSTVADQTKCEVTRAAYKQAYFYLDVLKQPEKTCNLDIVEYTKNAEGEYTQSYAGKINWSLSDVNWVASQIAGNSYSETMHVPTSCFDAKLGAALEVGPWEFTSRTSGNDVRIDFAVSGETKHGTYFNKVSLSARASQDNASSIGYEVEHLGSWMDKLTAIEYLTETSGLRGVDFALIDLPGVREEVMSLVNHWALNRALPAPTALAQEFGSIQNPYVMVDKDGNELPDVNFSINWGTKEIRSTPGPVTWAFYHWYGTNIGGGTSAAKAYLYTLARYDSRGTDTYKPVALEMRNYISLHEFDGYAPTGAETIKVLGQDYYALPENVLAYNAIQNIKQSTPYLISQYSRSELSANLNARVALENNVASAVTEDAALQELLKTNPDFAKLKSANPALLPWWVEFVAQFNAAPSDFPTGAHVSGTLVALQESGQLVWNAEQDCFFLNGYGCTARSNGALLTEAFETTLATHAVWKANADLAGLIETYIPEYSKQTEGLGPIYDLPAAAVSEYLSSFIGHEEKKLEAVDATGLRNLVVIDEYDRVSRF